MKHIHGTSRAWTKAFQIGMALLFVTLSPLPVAATPEFMWTGPWNVTLSPTNCAGPGPIPRECQGDKAFGASALSGQISDTTADRAIARTLDGSGLGSGGQTSGVIFSRPFTLSGSPDGWSVQLDGALQGTLSAGGTTASAGVTVDASITPALAIASNDRVVGLVSSLATHLEHLNLVKVGLLGDGNYSVSGQIQTSAGFGGAPPGVAAAAFFDSNGGWNVGVTAIPVPEPASGTFVASASAFLVWRFRTRRGGATRPRPMKIIV